jgi:predicted ester cyclase
MTIGGNPKEVYSEYLHVVWEQKNLAALEKYYAADFVDHAAPPGLPPGLAGARQLITMLQSAFPDYSVAIELQVSEGDLLVARLAESGTQRGILHGVPPTGRRIKTSSTHIIRFSGSKMCEHWSNRDDLGMMQQLGVIHLLGN